YLGENDPFLKGVANMIEEYDKDEVLRLQAQLRRDNEIEIRSMKNYAKKVGREEGLAEGRAEGKAQGLAEGRAEGKAQGIAEGKAQGIAEGEKAKAIEIAKNLLKLGVDIKLISEASGLSVEEIKRL
ncbi:MAG: hypothetical protein K6G48_03525, partial [Acholeplasmatales bacterium]|nr:hypothetical protein [Acholeplasmatales bacterium]